MKPVYYVLMLSLVWLCAGCEPKADKPSPEEVKQKEQQHVELQQELLQLVNRAEQNANHSFRLLIQNPKQKEEYKGKQNGQNWVIFDQQENKIMERKNTKVMAYHSGKKEEMTNQQAGLVSLKDHLQFLSQVYGKIEKENHKNNQENKLKVSVDSKKLAQTFKERVNNETGQALFPVYEEMDIYYELIYSDPEKNLKQLILHMQDKNKNKHTLTYVVVDQ